MTTESTGRPGRQYTGDEMRAMLTAGAEHLGLNIRAAVHLLTFTDLPAWRGFPGLVDFENVPARIIEGRGIVLSGGVHGVRVALVSDWAALPLDTRAARISGSGGRLLDLAVSMATGPRVVDLRENLAGFGHAHARRVIEAVAIATGADEFYTLTPTPALDALLAHQRELSGEPR